MKITMIGAGSVVFGENILTDILTHPALREDSIICLEDIDPNRLDLMYRMMLKYKELNPEKLENVSFEKTTDLKKSITDAKYVVSSIHVGGLDAFKYDIEIPYKYGVTQCVGDTLGPGGVFRFLRQSTALKKILEFIEEVGYQPEEDTSKPLFLNYANPMAMNTWYCNSLLPDSTIGLCHGVQGTAALLRNWIGVKPQDYSFLCAGINHLAWFLQLWYKEPDDPNKVWKNAYPLLFEKVKENPEIMGTEKLRWDMMEATGYFMTESSGHLSEYLPYYRKRADLLDNFKGSDTFHNSLLHGEVLRFDTLEAERVEKRLHRILNRNKLKLKKTATDEYASHIINAIETNKLFRFNGNVINKQGALITNLPRNCCVEVPIFVDHHGTHPQGGIELPSVCQALCMSNIMVQKAAVEGVLESDRENIYHAVLLDPNTASICSPREVRDMVDDLFEAEKEWLPKF
jgi:alpha-galactosidase